MDTSEDLAWAGTAFYSGERAAHRWGTESDDFAALTISTPFSPPSRRARRAFCFPTRRCRERGARDCWPRGVILSIRTPFR